MNILYDGMIYRLQKFGGINRYYINLIEKLPETITPSLIACDTETLYFPHHKNLQLLTFPLPRNNATYSRLERLCFRLRMLTNQKCFSLVHPTYYSFIANSSLQRFKLPSVLTVYDMIHELIPGVDNEGYWAIIKRKAIMAADAVICISESTKRDLLERMPIPESRIRVTHLASNLGANLTNGDEPVPESPYFLFVGSRAEGYKNFDGLLKAFAKVAAKYKDLSLCVVGSKFDERELRLIKELGLMDKIKLYQWANDAHLAKLYKHSLALVYPSFYEGFGIPPLEAMSCGTAVIASNTSSLPEVVGDAGLLFDPNSIEQLVEKMSYLYQNGGVRDELIARGLMQAKRFSWEKTAAQTLDLYHSVAR